VTTRPLAAPHLGGYRGHGRIQTTTSRRPWPTCSTHAGELGHGSSILPCRVELKLLSCCPLHNHPQCMPPMTSMASHCTKVEIHVLKPVLKQHSNAHTLPRAHLHHPAMHAGDTGASAAASFVAAASGPHSVLIRFVELVQFTFTFTFTALTERASRALIACFS
jgi:hypothetical protein